MVGLTWFIYSNIDLNGNIFSIKNEHMSWGNRQGLLNLANTMPDINRKSE